MLVMVLWWCKHQSVHQNTVHCTPSKLNRKKIKKLIHSSILQVFYAVASLAVSCRFIVVSMPFKCELFYVMHRNANFSRKELFFSFLCDLFHLIFIFVFCLFFCDAWNHCAVIDSNVERMKLNELQTLKNENMQNGVFAICLNEFSILHDQTSV